MPSPRTLQIVAFEFHCDCRRIARSLILLQLPGSANISPVIFTLPLMIRVPLSSIHWPPVLSSRWLRRISTRCSIAILVCRFRQCLSSSVISFGFFSFWNHLPHSESFPFPSLPFASGRPPVFPFPFPAPFPNGLSLVKVIGGFGGGGLGRTGALLAVSSSILTFPLYDKRISYFTMFSIRMPSELPPTLFLNMGFRSFATSLFPAVSTSDLWAGLLNSNPFRLLRRYAPVDPRPSLSP